ncbi:MAG TPA: hypothetical protein DIT01_16745 [Lentisphaeria bacterium]|nr:hypothetical protein [Lentisphaeria bacterium]
MYRSVTLSVSIVVSLMAAVVAQSLHAAPLTIVEDGRARAAIVVEAGEPKAMKAGQALQTYVEKMSGARLALIEEGQAVPGDVPVRLLVGHTQAARKLGVEIPSGYDTTIRPDIFEEEGYALKTVGRDLVIGGNNDGYYKGTLYAAYALLERLGCRWYFPDEWGEVVPKAKTITVPELDVVSRPDFPVRNVNPSGWVPMPGNERELYTEWGEKNGFNFHRFYPQTGDGLIGYLAPPLEYFETNPEFFAMNEQGERYHSEQPRVTMLCLSSPGLYAESVKNLRAAFAGEKKMLNVDELGFGISPPDGQPFCYCEECRKASLNFRYPRYFKRPFQSEEFFGFAARLAREFPDKFVATMAYVIREMVPQGVDIPENIKVMYTSAACDVLHANDSQLWRRRDSLRNLKTWCERSPHVTIYDYNPGFVIGSWVPERDTANFAINAPILREMGLKGYEAEGRKAFMTTWTSYYARAKFLWDADTDVEALMADFYNTFFGAAAGPHVQAWWEACEDVLVNSPMQAHEDFFINHIYTVDFVRSIRKHVKAARKAPATDVQRERVEAFALIADHLMAYAKMNDAEMRLDYAAAAAAAGRMVALENQLHEIYPFFIENGPTQDLKYFPAGRKKIFEAHAAKINGEGGDLVAPLPLEMTFRRDLYNEGIVAGWHEPEFDDRGWGTKNTYYTWDQQDPPEDEAGHDYDGIGWYRATLKVDPKFKDRPIKFWCGGAIDEGWVWINGKYAGHKISSIWWYHNHAFELDVTDLIEPGRKNTIAIRVLNPADIGGLFRRGFFWSPKQ